MCGITGIYQFKSTNKAELKEAIEKMNKSQARRGPDDEGVFVNEKNGVALGHRRLSILDLSKAGHQPMIFNLRTSDVPILAITFNGEIYNFLELRKDLEKRGHKFKTKTDTEVILALYAEYGEKSFSMFRGMFAFGLYDVGRRKLFLVKDRYGIKPLYYYTDNKKIIFASTVKAIAESGLIFIQKNIEAYISFLFLGFILSPITTVKNVFAVPAGHYLEINSDGGQKLVKYYEPLGFFNMGTSDVPDIDKNNFRTSEVQNIRGLLQESVNLHLISDAPLGVFLSGGLDSSAIAAIASEQRGKECGMTQNNNLTTLSIIFDEQEFSEQKYQRLVAEKIKSDHREIKITKNDFEAGFNEIFEAMDQPTIDGVNSFFVAKVAKQAGLKTVLSGLGADEIFLGYSHFHRAELLRRIQKTLSIFGRPTSLILNLLGDKYSKLSHFANDDILSFYLGTRGIFTSKEVAKILDINLSEVENFIINMGTSDVLQMSDVQKLDPVNLLSYLELKFYLQSQLLKDTDFMSMYHSIEVRVPFLDHKLVEYLSSFESQLKLNMGTSDVLRMSNVKNINKPLLVAAIRDLLPSEIFTRPKMGFTFPFQKWFKEKRVFGVGHWSKFWAKEVLSKF